MTTLQPEEQALLDDLAEKVVALRLAVPAMMFLETMAPMNMVGSSLLDVAAPIWRVFVPASRIDRFSRLLERRESLPALIAAIDEREEQRRLDQNAQPPRSTP